MLVVDIMHEFELGIWKGVLTHLIRMLHSLDRSKIMLLNERYVQSTDCIHPSDSLY